MLSDYIRRIMVLLSSSASMPRDDKVVQMMWPIQAGGIRHRRRASGTHLPICTTLSCATTDAPANCPSNAGSCRPLSCGYDEREAYLASDGKGRKMLPAFGAERTEMLEKAIDRMTSVLPEVRYFTSPRAIRSFPTPTYVARWRAQNGTMRRKGGRERGGFGRGDALHKQAFGLSVRLGAVYMPQYRCGRRPCGCRRVPDIKSFVFEG